jgi:hypothetical protein
LPGRAHHHQRPVCRPESRDLDALQGQDVHQRADDDRDHREDDERDDVDKLTDAQTVVRPRVQEVCEQEARDDRSHSRAQAAHDRNEDDRQEHAEELSRYPK